MAEVKAYTMIVIITDTIETNEYSFQLKVTNQPPKTTSTFVTPIIIKFGEKTPYDLPASMDPEGLFYTTTIFSGPSFASLISSTQLQLYPKNCATDFRNFTVKIKLEDEQPASTNYSIDF